MSKAAIKKIDWSVYTPFQERVLKIVCTIPKGEVWTYRLVAAKLGNSNWARAVGTALKKCRDSEVPCHRVVGYNDLGGYSAPGGLMTKKKLLKKEGHFK